MSVTMCECRKQEDMEVTDKTERCNSRVKGGDRQVKWVEESRKNLNSVPL